LYGVLDDELSISQLPDAPAKQIDDQNQCPGLWDDGIKRETGVNCNIHGAMPLSPLIFSPLSENLLKS